MAETKVKVRLDTRIAKKALDGLTKQAKSTGARVSRDLKGAVTSGFGLGAGFGAGVAALKQASAGGVGDVVGDALGGFGAEIAEFFLGDSDDKARAQKAAREEIKDSFASVISRQGKVVTPSIQAAFDNIYSHRIHEEVGKGVIDREAAFGGKEAGKMIDRLATVITDSLKEAADYLYEKIPFVGGK